MTRQAELAIINDPPNGLSILLGSERPVTGTDEIVLLDVANDGGRKGRTLVEVSIWFTRKTRGRVTVPAR